MGTAGHRACWGKHSMMLSGLEKFCNQTRKQITHDSRDLECPDSPVPPVWSHCFPWDLHALMDLGAVVDYLSVFFW